MINYTLTQKDKALTKTFLEWCNSNHVRQFTSDDFHRCKLSTTDPDRPGVTMTLYDLFDDPQHEIGALIAKWKFHGFIQSEHREVPSSVPSNHNRRVDVWCWHARVEGWLHLKPLTAYY
jgi:hypothetical protein